MASKKKEDRIKSGTPISPYGRKSKEATSGGLSGDGKQIQINVWQEWSENDINNEKWDVTSKIKDKDKTKSPQLSQNLFDDPDGRVRLPSSIKVVKWRRVSDYFVKTPVIVDSEKGVHDFDIFSPNEHLFVSETLRWIICQINTLWITSTRKVSEDIENQNHDTNFVSTDGSYHTWKFWEHIYSLNKVGKGIPLYNPAGKYIVKLFWMGEWRKIYVDDNLPFDENDQMLLPVTNISNEIWPIIITKALLKIASLSYGFPSNVTEFGDFSVIHALTGWIPQMKIITKEYRNEIGKLLGDLLPNWNFEEKEKSFIVSDNVENVVSPDHHEMLHDKGESNQKDKKEKKENKDNKVKDKKEKEKEKNKPATTEGKSQHEHPETIIFASYKSNIMKVNMFALSKMADHNEALRKIGLAQSYSHPVLLNYYRDCPLIKPKTPELIPAWKLIRPLVKHEIPQSKDCLLHNLENCNTIQEDGDLKYIEIQTPFLHFKISNNTFPAIYQKGSRNSIPDIVEDENEEKTEVNDNNFGTERSEDKEDFPEVETMKKKSNAMKKIQQQLNDTDEVFNEKDSTKINTKENDHSKSWINIDNFCDCFQALYVYHKVETYNVSETLMDNKANIDQKEPMYLFVDNTESSEIIFCLSTFCKWLTPLEIPLTIDNQTNRNSPSMSILKDTNIENVYIENDVELNNQSPLHLCSFIAERHNWKTFKVGNIFKRARTNGTKAISLKFPPGRHCIRIFIESKNGYHCKVISQNQFYLKNEDSIMPLFTEEPKRMKDFALNIMQSFAKIIEHFSTIDERRNCEQCFINLIMPFVGNQQMKDISKNFTQIFGHILLRVINQLNPEIITQDMIFSIRSLTLFFESNLYILNPQQKQQLSSNKNSAKGVTSISTKVDSRKQSSTKSVIYSDSKDDRKVEANIKEYHEEDIIKVQKYCKGFHVRNVINARNPNVNMHSRVTTEIKKLMSIIEQNSLKYGINILNDIYFKYPKIFKCYGFENDKLNHISLQEFSGTNTTLFGSGFEVLFREIFYLNKNKSKMDLIVKLNCLSSKCTLMVINNDNGESFSDNILKRINLYNLQTNSKGYTILSFIKDAETTVNWKLKLICDGNDILPNSLKQELCSDFSVTKIRDYYIPNRQGLLFHQLIKVKNDHPTTIYVKLSNPLIPFRLCIYNYDEEVYSVDEQGEALIPSFIFAKDDITDTGSGRSPSRNSNKSKKNKEKQSARNSGTDSSGSGDEGKVNKFSIRAYVNKEIWTLSEENQEFVINLVRARKKEMAENKLFNENQSKTTQGIESSKKDASQKSQTKAKGKDKGQDNTKITKGNEKSGSKAMIGDTMSSRPNSNSFESDKAHWTFYLTSDAILEDNIQILKNNEKYESLFATKKVWEEMDPIRFDKGKQIQQKYIEENKISNDENENDPNFKVILKPLDISQYYRKNNFIDGGKINSEESRMKSIEEFRRHQLEWNLWCQNEKSERNKKIINNLNYYNQLQEAVNSHRSEYFKIRENIRKNQQNAMKTSEIKNN